MIDWTVEPEAALVALTRHADYRHSTFGLLVPARLHGIDWVGDPRAGVPCAERHLTTLAQLCATAGLAVDATAVGDPEPVTATLDALRDRPADQILLCNRPRHFAVPAPLSLAWRLARATQLPVTSAPPPLPAGRKTGRVAVANQRNRLLSSRCT